MSVEFNPRAKKGEQYAVVTPDGKRFERLPRHTAEGVLIAQGKTLREVQAAIADARLRSLGLA